MCAIGKRGPGGGIVFYVSPGGFLSGPNGDTVFHHLEAAPGDAGGTSYKWSYTLNTTVGTGLFIGAGAANTARAVAQDSTSNRAVTLADSYTTTVDGVVYSDWFLPSRDELDVMYFHRQRIGGFATFSYWSSSESSGNDVWYQGFPTGFQDSRSKGFDSRVRPVRAF